MTLTLLPTLVVLVAAIAHASWHGVVKSGRDKLLTAAIIYSVGSVGAFFLLPLTDLPVRAVWPWLLVSVAVHNIYLAFLTFAYERGDLSQVYPIGRGLVPMLLAGMAYVVAGEALGQWQIIGIIVISAGIASLA